MYINILNIILGIVLVILMVYLGYNLYLSNKDIVRYEPPEFEDSEVKELEKIPVYNSKIILKTVENFSGLVSFKVKTTGSDKGFQIDWGNGLKVSYTGSSFIQKLPPMFYNPGLYTITIFCENDTFENVEYVSSYPDLKSINVENMGLPQGLKSTGNLTFVKTKV